MFKKYKIKKEIKIPAYNNRRQRFLGESLANFGLEINKLGLEFGPVNEQGVVSLFSKIHRHIGFPRIKYINDFFPDCEATCDIGAKEHWVNIEFKYKLRFYINPGDIDKWRTKVDYLVCWEMDNRAMPEKIRPVKIIALKDYLMDKTVIANINGE